MARHDAGIDDAPRRGDAWTLACGDTIEVADAAAWNAPAYERVLWRTRDGEAIAMAKLHTASNRGAPGMVVLCDIEVRDTHRGQRLALDTIAAITGRSGQQVRVSGNYTPSGYAALGAHLEPKDPDTEPRVAFDEMTFVADWDTRTLQHP